MNILEGIDDLLLESNREIDRVESYFSLTGKQKSRALVSEYPEKFFKWMKKSGKDHSDDFWSISKEQGIDRGDEEGAKNYVILQPVSLPESMLSDFFDWMERNGLDRRDPYAPSWLTMDFEKKIKDHWLVHYTDSESQYQISRNGFEYGVYDVRHLALTTALTKKTKSGGGYNFAFTPFDADRYCPEGCGYGSHVVAFKADAALVYHYGDQQRQAVFWGPSVDSSDIYRISPTKGRDRSKGKWRIDKGYDEVFPDSISWAVERLNDEII